MPPSCVSPLAGSLAGANVVAFTTAPAPQHSVSVPRNDGHSPENCFPYAAKLTCCGIDWNVHRPVNRSSGCTYSSDAGRRTAKSSVSTIVDDELEVSSSVSKNPERRLFLKLTSSIVLHYCRRNHGTQFITYPVLNIVRIFG